jgi:hypothetical protein
VPCCASLESASLLVRSGVSQRTAHAHAAAGDALSQTDFDVFWSRVPETAKDETGEADYGEGRTHKPDSALNAWADGGFWRAILENYLGPRYESCTPVVITSWPGAPNQPWHRDFGLAAVMTGLIDCTDANGLGPTEFIVSSHVIGTLPQFVRPDREIVGKVEVLHQWIGWLLSSAPVRVAVALVNHALGWQLPVPVPLRAYLPAGSLIIFDCRMLHRGGPNVGRQKRPIVSFDYQECAEE